MPTLCRLSTQSTQAHAPALQTKACILQHTASPRRPQLTQQCNSLATATYAQSCLPPLCGLRPLPQGSTRKPRPPWVTAPCSIAHRCPLCHTSVAPAPNVCTCLPLRLTSPMSLPSFEHSPGLEIVSHLPVAAQASRPACLCNRSAHLNAPPASPPASVPTSNLCPFPSSCHSIHLTSAPRPSLGRMVCLLCPLVSSAPPPVPCVARPRVPLSPSHHPLCLSQIHTIPHRAIA